MRPAFPGAVLLLSLLAPVPAAAVGVDAPIVQEAVKGPCIDLTRVGDGEVLQVVALPPCGPDARVRIRHCNGTVTIEVWTTWPRPFDYHLNIRTGEIEKIVDYGVNSAEGCQDTSP